MASDGSPTPSPDTRPTPPAGDAGPGAETGGGDASTTAPSAGLPAWAGVYDANGVWDLAGPFAGGRTLGNVVGDLLVEEIVKRAGVPSVLQEKAEDAVRALIADKVKAKVDMNLPASLQPSSPLMMKLAAVFASTEVTSTISLQPGPRAGTVAGTEEIRSFTLGSGTSKKVLAPGDLLERTVPLVTIGADWTGKEAGAGVLAIDQHDVSLRLGKMVLWVVDNVLEEQGAKSLSDAAASVIDCAALSALLLGNDDTFTFGVSLLSYTVTGGAVRDGCGAVTGLVKGRALGLFDLEAGVEVGGNVQHLDDDSDGIADRLRSQTGFGGIVTKVFPGPLAPRVPVRFEAVRRPGPRVPGGTAPHYADMSNVIGTTARLPVRGRVFQVADGFDPAATTPFAQISQQELPGEPVMVTTAGATPVALGTVTTDAEGYLDTALDVTSANLPSGNCGLRFLVRGRVAGTASARLLDPAATALVVRSDVDLTYLDTDFMSATGKLQLLIQRGAERRTLPAMEALYRGLRRGATSAEDLPLTFLSGSPGFFKLVLDQKMRLDQVAQDGVVLKPFKDIIAMKVSDVDLGGIVPALEEQVGYKLSALLRLRLDVPPQTQEILMGDDSEADAVAYFLYHALTSRQLTAEALLARLDTIPVDATWKAPIAELAPRVVAALPSTPPVVAIYINRTGKPNPRFPVADWTAPGLTRAHAGAWPLALDLFEEGHLSAPAVGAVRARLLALGAKPADLTAAAQAAVLAGYLRTETVAAFP